MRILRGFGMSQAIAHHIEPILLARRGTRISGLLEPARCERLRGLLGPVRVELGFDADSGGQPLARGRLEAEIELCCERCLQPMVLRLEPRVCWRFVRPVDTGAEAGADSGSADTDGAAAHEDIDFEGGAIDLLALIEDELLLAVPVYPRHAHACSAWVAPARDTDTAPAQGPAPGTKRPFAGLAGLLGRPPDPSDERKD